MFMQMHIIEAMSLKPFVSNDCQKKGGDCDNRLSCCPGLVCRVNWGGAFCFWEKLLVIGIYAT